MVNRGTGKVPIQPEVWVLNKRLLEKINTSGRVYLTHTSLNESYVLRMAIGQRTTQREHVEEAWRIICHEADTLLLES